VHEHSHTCSHGVSEESIEATIRAFTDLENAGNKRSMTKMARRLSKEQPALLKYASEFREQHGDKVGEAAIFYGTLIWAIYDRVLGKSPQLTEANLEAARAIIAEEQKSAPGIDSLPVHKRILPTVAERQPHICEKLSELVEEDVREKAMTEETASLIMPPTQVILEAFDAAAEGRRPGTKLGPVVRDSPKVGRNDPCACGSGKKFKKCCGA
jgi:hypothetical protein